MLLVFAAKPILPDVPASALRIALIIILIIWTVIWFIIRTSLPKNKKGRIGIIVSIEAENDKQKIRLKNDFFKRLHDQAVKNGIDTLVNFIQIGGLKTYKVNRILTDYTLKSKYESQESSEVQKSIKSFSKLKKRINGNFYIWGNIKERQDIENKYYLDLNGLILHSPLDNPVKTKLSEEFNMVWARSINFQEKIELKGFLISADLIFIAIEYIIGLAAFFTGNAELAEKLHANLENEINKIKGPLPNIIHIRKSLSDLIPIECNLAAAMFLNRGNPDQSEVYLRKSFHRAPDNYSALITQSVLQFCYRKDAQGALLSVRKAKKLAETDGTWRFNEAFLLMYLKKFEEALLIYSEIERISFPNEDRILSEVLEFNKTQIKKEPKFFQSYYILGFLYYKKIGNYPEAFGYFEHLVTFCKDQRYKLLIEKANEYLEELNLRMNLK